MSTYSTIDPPQEAYDGLLPPPPAQPRAMIENALAEQILHQLEIIQADIKDLKETLENGKSE